MARQLKRGIMLGQMLVLAVAMSLVVPASEPASAAAADILVADLDAGGPPQNGPGRVVRLNDSGSETGSYSGVDFKEPSGIALAANGDLLVADAEAFGGKGGIIRLNSITGAKITDYQGGNFVEPTAVAALPSGEILVVDQDAFPSGTLCDDSEGGETKVGCGAVIKIDPATKGQTRFDSGTSFWNPTGIAIAPDGSILVADLDAPGPGAAAGGGPGRVFRLSSSGAQIAQYSIPGSVEPSGVAADASGDIFVVDAVAFAEHGGVFRLNSAGQKTREYFGGDFDEPTGIAIAWNGDILVADQDAGGPFESGPGGVIRVNRDTAAQTTYFSSGSFVNPAGITVEPGSPPGPGPGPTPTPPKCQNLQATLSGTNGKDNLKGSPVRDVIVGLGGNDTIKALEGHDRVCAGTGKDKVSGGPGKDRLHGEAGNDKLIGGPGADRLVGGKGKDTCIGGPGIDKAIGCEIKVDIP